MNWKGIHKVNLVLAWNINMYNLCVCVCVFCCNVQCYTCKCTFTKVLVSSLLDLTKTGTAKKRARGKENVATSASKRPKAKATDKASKAKPTASKQAKAKKAKTNPTTKSKGDFVSKLYILVISLPG